MVKRKRVVAVVVAIAALGTTGTASAATSGSTPAPSPTKSGAPAVAGNDKSVDKSAGKSDGKSAGKSADAGKDEFAAIAAKLGVTTDRLNAATVAAKMSLASTNGGTPQAFYAAIAANLGLPVARVQDALGTEIFRKGPEGGKPSKNGVPGPSPFSTDSAAAFVAHELGVDQKKAKTALAAVVALSDARGGIDPTSKAFGDIAASLGVSSSKLATALTDLKMSIGGTKG